jgi:hypothetical protein
MNFDEFFEEKFGPEPYPGMSLEGLWKDADAHRRLLNIAENKIRTRENWIYRRSAAKIVWESKEKDKK